MKIENFFLKKKEKFDLRFHHRLKNSNISPLKVYSKEIIKDYKKFGKNYFDNKNIKIGYGNYIYDGRFKTPVKKIIKFFKLKKNSKILEVGCAKGFLIYEFYKNKMDVFGVDISKYALSKCINTIKNKIYLSNLSENLTFKQFSFDFIICKEVIPHLKKTEIKRLIKNLNLLSINVKKIYLIIQVPRSNKYKKNFVNWDITHRTIMTKNNWIKFLKNNNFKGKVSFKDLV